MAAESQGQAVIFRGAPLRVRISTAPASLDLGAGGWSQKQHWRIRMPATVTPPPAELETIKDIATGRTYVIRGVMAAGMSPLSAEHICDADWQ